MKKTTESKKIRLALIGASKIAAKVLPSIRAVSEIEVMAVAAKRPGAAELFAKTHGISRYYESYEDCLADPSVDAVYVSTLNCDHAALIKKSLDAGKHVLCEKPLVPTAKEAEYFFSIAEKKNLILLEGFMYRFHPQIKMLKEMIESEKIGEIRSIRINFSFVLYDFATSDLPLRATSRGLGGALMDVGCYGVDFVNSIIGSVTVDNPHINVVTRLHPEDSSYDLATSAVLKFKNGLTAVIECAADTPSLNTWEVSGTQGSVAALRFDPQGRSDAPLYYVNEDSEAQLIMCPSVNTFEAEFRHFSRCVLGFESQHIKPSESIQNAKTIESIRTHTQSR